MEMKDNVRRIILTAFAVFCILALGGYCSGSSSTASTNSTQATVSDR